MREVQDMYMYSTTHEQLECMFERAYMNTRTRTREYSNTYTRSVALVQYTRVQCVNTLICTCTHEPIACK